MEELNQELAKKQFLPIVYIMGRYVEQPPGKHTNGGGLLYWGLFTIPSFLLFLPLISKQREYSLLRAGCKDES